MRSRQVFPSLFLSALLVGGLCHGQSLGDAARQARQQKQKNGAAAKKVYDLPTSSDSPGVTSSSTASEDDPVPYTSEGSVGFTPELWLKTIKAQKDWIAHLQQLEEKLKEPPQFDPKVETPEAKRQWEERAHQERLVAQIPAQKKKLVQMQADARQAGMPLWIVNPH